MGTQYKDVAVRETGEVISLPQSFINNTKEYFIRSKNQDKAFKQKLQRADEHFFWVNQNNITSLLTDKNISQSSLGLLLVLCCNLQNVIGILCNQKRNPYTNKELINKSGVPERSFFKGIEELKSHKIVINNGTKKEPIYTVDMKYHFIGTNNQASHSVRAYKDGIRALKDSGLTLNKIGFLYSVIPLLEFNRCALVKDKNKGVDVNNLHSKDSLCKLYLGISKRTLSTYLSMTFEYKI